MANDAKTELKKLNNLFKTVFESPNGVAVLKELRARHIGSSALGSTPQETAYLLGKKELVEDIQNILDLTDQDINNLEYVNIYDTDFTLDQ